jgi:ketosteroid isomerase-like protein
MTKANVTAVRAFFAAVNRGDLDDAVEALDRECEFDWSRSRSPERGLYRGHEAVKRLYERFFESWTEREFFETEIIASDDAVVRVGGFRGRGRASGVATSASAALLWTFRDGKAISARMYQSKAEALDAIGLDTPSGPFARSGAARPDHEALRFGLRSCEQATSPVNCSYCSGDQPRSRTRSSHRWG